MNLGGGLIKIKNFKNVGSNLFKFFFLTNSYFISTVKNIIFVYS